MGYIKAALPYFLLFVPFMCFTQLPKPATGMIRRFADFPSRYVQPRNIDVWLPESYDSTRQYAVLYMHDGQMLFDSTVTWNAQEWRIDEVLGQLIKAKMVQPCIVVGIWNTGVSRSAEYFPQQPLQHLFRTVKDSLVRQELQGKPQADQYLLFLTRELKPFIDRHFSTYADQAHTYIAGSSMGGLISLYAICKYPNVFHGAACLSTHWPGSLRQNTGAIPRAFNRYWKRHLPAPENHRIYFDHGTETLDKLYPPYQEAVDKIMQAKGFTAASWMTQVFNGADHSERSWSRRLDVPLMFLLGK